MTGLAAGATLDGRYCLVECLGSGGQGEVWRVSDLAAPEQRLAVKLVNVAGKASTIVERSRREARTLHRLSHPSLVRCHRVFEDLGRDLLGLVVDYVDGVPLSVVIADPRLTGDLRIQCLTHLAAALAHLHAHGLVHRDLKPSNVLVDTAFFEHGADPSTIKLVDFGIVTEAGNPSPLTRTGHGVGTLPYMAPEELEPSFWRRPTDAPALDVFAFGILSYEVLRGGHPTHLGQATAAEYASAYRAARDEAGWPATAGSGDWADLIRDCLALDGRRRIQDAGVILSRLGVQPEPLLASTEDAVPAVGAKGRSGALPASTDGASTNDAVIRTPGGAPLRGHAARPGSTTWSRASGAVRWAGGVVAVGIAAAALWATSGSPSTSPAARVDAPHSKPVNRVALPDGDFPTPFELQREKVPSGLSQLAAASACHDAGMDLCTATQWRHHCAARPELATAETWTATLLPSENGVRAVVAGLGTCEEGHPAPVDETVAHRESVCCTSAIAATDESTRGVIPLMAAFVRAANIKNDDEYRAGLRSILAPTLDKYFLMKGVPREKAIEASVRSRNTFVLGIPERCAASHELPEMFRAGDIPVTCRGYLTGTGPELSKIVDSHYSVRNGQLASVTDVVVRKVTEPSAAKP